MSARDWARYPRTMWRLKLLQISLGYAYRWMLPSADGSRFSRFTMPDGGELTITAIAPVTVMRDMG